MSITRRLYIVWRCSSLSIFPEAYKECAFSCFKRTEASHPPPGYGLYALVANCERPLIYYDKNNNQHNHVFTYLLLANYGSFMPRGSLMKQALCLLYKHRYSVI